MVDFLGREGFRVVGSPPFFSGQPAGGTYESAFLFGLFVIFYGFYQW